MAAGDRTNARRVQRPPVFSTWLAIRSRCPGERAVAQLRAVLCRCQQATVMAASADPRRADRRVWAGQRPLADCGEVSMAATRRPRVAQSTTALPEGKVSGIMTGHNL